MTNSRELETYLVHTQAEPSTFSSLSTFPEEFKVNLDDTDVVDLAHAACMPQVGGMMRIFSRPGANQIRMRRSDDLIRASAEEGMIRRTQAAQLSYAAPYFRVGWIRIAVEIKAEESSVKHRRGRSC